MMLLPAKTQSEVAKALDELEMLVGKDGFKAHFNTILTDRGSEFLDAELLERSIDGEKRCSVYYCDPLQSGQKGGCEKNHVELRKIIPKGTSLKDLTPTELSHICSHVNSYTRPSLGGKSPYELASAVLPESLLKGLGLEFIAPEDVIMRPSLLKELGLR
jgi:IS30 family transposase